MTWCAPTRGPAIVRSSIWLRQLEGGGGRQMGDYPGEDVVPISGSSNEIAEALGAFDAAGAAHIQLVVDPITLDSIDQLGDVLAILNR